MTTLQYLEELVKGINESKGTINCAHCAFRLDDHFKHRRNLGLGPVSTSSANSFTLHPRIKKHVRAISKDPRVVERCAMPNTGNYRIICDLEEENIQYYIDLNDTSTATDQVRLIVSSESDVTDTLQYLCRDEIDNAAFGFIVLTHQNTQNQYAQQIGHILNFYVDKNNEVFFIDAQKPEGQQISRQLSLRGYQNEIFYIQSQPLEKNLKPKYEKLTEQTTKKEPILVNALNPTAPHSQTTMHTHEMIASSSLSLVPTQSAVLVQQQKQNYIEINRILSEKGNVTFQEHSKLCDILLKNAYSLTEHNKNFLYEKIKDKNEQNSMNVRAWVVRVILEISKENISEAVKGSKKIIEIEQNHFVGWLSEIMSMIEGMKKFPSLITKEYCERALFCLEKLENAMFNRVNNASFSFFIATCFQKLRCFRQAMTCYKKALIHNPKDVNAWRCFGDFHKVELRNPGLAEMLYLNIERIRKNENVVPYDEIAQSYWEKNRKENYQTIVEIINKSELLSQEEFYQIEQITSPGKLNEDDKKTLHELIEKKNQEDFQNVRAWAVRVFLEVHGEGAAEHYSFLMSIVKKMRDWRPDYFLGFGLQAFLMIDAMEKTASLVTKGNCEETFHCLQKSRELGIKNCYDLWRKLGGYFQKFESPHVLECYKISLATNPRCEETWKNLGNYFNELNDGFFRLAKKKAAACCFDNIKKIQELQPIMLLDTIICKMEIDEKNDVVNVNNYHEAEDILIRKVLTKNEYNALLFILAVPGSMNPQQQNFLYESIKKECEKEESDAKNFFIRAMFELWGVGTAKDSLSADAFIEKGMALKPNNMVGFSLRMLSLLESMKENTSLITEENCNNIFLHFEKNIQIIKVKPTHWKDLADCYYKLNLYPQALKCYKALVKYNPRNNYGWQLLGIFYKEQLKNDTLYKHCSENLTRIAEEKDIIPLSEELAAVSPPPSTVSSSTKVANLPLPATAKAAAVVPLPPNMVSPSAKAENPPLPATVKAAPVAIMPSSVTSSSSNTENFQNSLIFSNIHRNSSRTASENGNENSTLLEELARLRKENQELRENLGLSEKKLALKDRKLEVQAEELEIKDEEIASLKRRLGAGNVAESNKKLRLQY